jgi:hypothetical protein
VFSALLHVVKVHRHIKIVKTKRNTGVSTILKAILVYFKSDVGNSEKKSEIV